MQHPPVPSDHPIQQPASPSIRRLNIELTQEPVYNTHPWLLAGILLAIAVLLSTAFAYIDTHRQALPLQTSRSPSK